MTPLPTCPDSCGGAPMQHDGRRVLLHPSYIEGFRNALRDARADLHALNFRHQCALADLQAEVAELRAILHDVVTSLREKADEDLSTLRRQLMTALVRLERDRSKPLH